MNSYVVVEMKGNQDNVKKYTKTLESINFIDLTGESTGWIARFLLDEELDDTSSMWVWEEGKEGKLRDLAQLT